MSPNRLAIDPAPTPAANRDALRLVIIAVTHESGPMDPDSSKQIITSAPESSVTIFGFTVAVTVTAVPGVTIASVESCRSAVAHVQSTVPPAGGEATTHTRYLVARAVIA